MKHKIVLIPFPFDDLSTTKVRPAICLMEQISIYNHIVIAFITSQIQYATEVTDVLIPQAHKDFQQTGLAIDSAIRLHRLITLPTNLIQRELGQLPTSFHTELDDKLRALFAL